MLKINGSKNRHEAEHKQQHIHMLIPSQRHGNKPADLDLWQNSLSGVLPTELALFGFGGGGEAPPAGR